MKNRQKWAAALALAATGAAVPAQAQTHCWAPREVRAAQVRQMQTMLMVAALRCRAAGIQMSEDYNGFVKTKLDALSAANLVIKQHFVQNGGTQDDYDRFTTSLANSFGDDETTSATCAEAATLAHDGAGAAAAEALEAIALVRVFPAALPGGSCEAPAAPVAMAALVPAEDARALPPLVRIAAPSAASAALPTFAPAAPSGPGLVALAAPAKATPLARYAAAQAPAPVPTQQPVTLPADVVAAMTVLARFQIEQQAAKPAPVTQVAAVVR